MNLRLLTLFIFIIVGLQREAVSQVSYNKRIIGSIGSNPKADDFHNSASLDNVDMSTGTLKIAIPLYEIKVNDISVPITLNYSALGLKVGQEAGVVGMGWELSAGGKVITNIQGRKDDSPEGIQFSPMPEQFDLSDYYDKESVNNLIDGKRDNAWDTYNYILPNGGGTYVKNGLTFPYDPLIRIEHPNKIKTTDGLIYNFSTGDIRKSSKRTYYEPDALEPVWIQNWRPDPLAVQWEDRDLSSIISTRFKDTVSFKYKYLDIAKQNDMARLIAKTKIATSESLPLYRDVEARSKMAGGISFTINDQRYKILEPMISRSKIEYIQHSILDTIDFPNGRIVFDYYADVLGRDALKNMSIFQKSHNQYVLLKRYLFEYDADLTYGHYLNSISVINSDEENRETWMFTYHDKLPAVPLENNKAQDRWGFYNGATQNKTLLENPNDVLALRIRPHFPIGVGPDPTVNYLKILYTRGEGLEHYGSNNVQTDPVTGLKSYSIEFANRNFFFSDAIKGTLKSVKVPNGGRYEYDYEPHKFRYYYYPGTNNFSYMQHAEGGGIRVKSILKDVGHTDLYQYSDFERRFKKRYEYGDALYESSGSENEVAGWGMVTIPGSVLRNTSVYYDSQNPGTTDVENLMLLSHPVNNMEQYGGSYGMYRAVTEYRDSASPLNSAVNYGKSVYYSNLPFLSPDEDWWHDGGTLNVPSIPHLHYSPGVKKLSWEGINGIKRYESKGNGEYALAEEIKYTFDFFDAPQNNENKLLSFFGTITGQMSGPFPYNPVSIEDEVFTIEAPLGVFTSHFNHVSQVNGTDGVGYMDYLSRTYHTTEEKTIAYPGKYRFDIINLNQFSNCVRKSSEHKTISHDYRAINDYITTRYYYDNKAHLLPTRISTESSKGDSTFTKIKYPQDMPNINSNSPFGYMRNLGIGLSEPIETYNTYYRKIDSISKEEVVTGGTINTFRELDGAIYPHKVYEMVVPSNFLYTNLPLFDGGDHPVDTSLFKQQLHYDMYLKGNLHTYTEKNGPGNVVLWGYNNQYPIAKVANANRIYNYEKTSDVAYTSFENADDGNWSYTGSPIFENYGPSGNKVYELSSGSISKSNPTVSDKYIISYWYKSGAVVNVTGGTVGAAVIKNSKGNWIYAEQEISGNISSVTVSGSGKIDELRFYPHDAQMSTYVYDPLIGLITSFDPRGVGQYYEYDYSQRLKTVRDQKGNIIKSYKYIIGSLNDQL